MMILCVDAGNSGIKTALVDGMNVVAFHRCALSGRKPPPFRALFPEAVLQVRHDLEGAAVSSVVPHLNARVNAHIRRLIGKRPLFISARMRLPFALAVAAPSRVGSDRLAAAAGAASRVNKGAFIVDIGSAITVDLLSRGSYQGGIIMAGPGLALSALSERTANLPKINFYDRTFILTGRFDDTRHSLLLGAGIGTIGAIKEAVSELASREGRLPVYITGGAVPLLADRIPRSWRSDPHLIMRGLALIWRLNRS